MGKKPNLSFRNQEYCAHCGMTAKKRCRCCGEPLCDYCAKTDGMCDDCNDEEREYVDEKYRRTTTRAY